MNVCLFVETVSPRPPNEDPEVQPVHGWTLKHSRSIRRSKTKASDRAPRNAQPPLLLYAYSAGTNPVHVPRGGLGKDANGQGGETVRETSQSY